MPAAPTTGSPALPAPSPAVTPGGLDSVLFSEGSAIRREGRIPDSPNAPWVFKHHATHWEFVLDEDGDAGEWLPVLTAFHVQPGANGTRMQKGGRLDPRISRGALETSGFKLIPSDQVVKRAESVSGRPYYHDVFSTPHIIGRSVSWSFDHAAFNAWRRSLVVSGYLAPPDQIALNFHMRVQERLVTRLSKNAHRPATAERYEREQRLLLLMRATPPAASSPKPSAAARLPRRPAPMPDIRSGETPGARPAIDRMTERLHRDGGGHLRDKQKAHEEAVRIAKRHDWEKSNLPR